MTFGNLYGGESRIDQYHLMVIGRSGQIIFDTTTTKGWDAQNTKRTDKFEDVQNSVFTYQLRVAFCHSIASRSRLVGIPGL